MPAKAPPNTPAPDGAAAAPQWLPNFCGPGVLLAVIIVVELLVVAVLIAPSDESQPLLPRLGTATLFAQWIALLCVLSLCEFRAWIGKLTPRSGVVAAYALILAITLTCSTLVSTLDQLLGLRLTLPAEFQWRFVLRSVALSALVGAALLRYFYVIEQWRARVRAEAQARGDALQARIRPHFLFNSMNTIASLIRTHPADAEHAVEDLSDLFRAALGADNKLSTLGAEIELARRYLAIERLRLGDRLQVEMDLEGVPEDLPVPALLLQPLVENAVYHGVQPLARGGLVRVRGTRLGAGAEITISNPRPPPGERAPPRHGIALANTRSRIEYHFGWRGTLTVRESDEEFVVILRLPDPAT
ncbi:MAG: sensor histidine kinase [Rudaea sp.]